MNNLVERTLWQLCGDENIRSAITKIVADSGLSYESGETVVSDNQANEFMDYRIKSIRFSDFRLFPKLEDKAFGLSFTTEGNTSSCIFLGSNGTGKSSIFTALEYAYTGHSSYKESSNETDSYLNYAFSGKGTTSLLLNICSQESIKEIQISNNNTMDFPRSFFCSEFDINTLSQEHNLTKYILEQTGFADLWKIKCEIANKIDRLSNSQIPDNFISSRRIREVLLELKNMTADKREEASRLSLLETIGNEELEKTHYLFPARWSSLVTTTGSTGKQIPATDPLSTVVIDEIAASKLLNMYKELSSLVSENGLDKLRELVSNMETITENDDNEGITKEIDILGTVQGKVEIIIRDLLDEVIDGYANFIENIMCHFSSPNEKEKFKFIRTGDTNISLVIKVTGYKESFTATPRSYLNTFRFRLYCIILKVSLSIWYMKKTKKILPIVIDDIFSSSDFNNSNRLDYLIFNIFSLYHRHINKGCNCDIPLQLIILTHDNLAKLSLEKGFKASMMARKRTSDMISKRIFAPNDILVKENVFSKDNVINLYLQ